MKSNELLKTIGFNINKIRRDKGIKGETLGKELGITKAAVSNIENGLVDCKISVLHRIAAFLDTDLPVFFEESGSVNIKEEQLSDYREQLKKQIRIIDLLVCRIEFLNEQIECMRMEKAG
ncbi:MAG: Helix-turn-helix domain [Segetibacter sp.]|nr:Helix-turn-helix domain [Segetibacter sp.]